MRRRWLSWGKTARVREAGLRTLARIGSAPAQSAVSDLGRTGVAGLDRYFVINIDHCPYGVLVAI